MLQLIDPKHRVFRQRLGLDLSCLLLLLLVLRRKLGKLGVSRFELLSHVCHFGLGFGRTASPRSFQFAHRSAILLLRLGALRFDGSALLFDRLQQSPLIVGGRWLSIAPFAIFPFTGLLTDRGSRERGTRKGNQAELQQSNSLCI
jgi:hypothetical protein